MTILAFIGFVVLLICAVGMTVIAIQLLIAATEFDLEAIPFVAAAAWAFILWAIPPVEVLMKLRGGV